MLCAPFTALDFASVLLFLNTNFTGVGWPMTLTGSGNSLIRNLLWPDDTIPLALLAKPSNFDKNNFSPFTNLQRFQVHHVNRGWIGFETLPGKGFLVCS